MSGEPFIPYDILEIIADKYSMDVEALVKVYTKGLVSGVRSQSGNQGDGSETEET